MKKAIHPATLLAIRSAVLFNASRAAGTVNQTLTNFAAGIANDTASSLAEFIAPTVPTGAQHGQFKVFSDSDAFKVYNTARAVGGPATRIEFNASDAFFNCKPQGLAIAIDDSERDPGADPLAIERAKIRTLVINTETGHEAKVFDLIKSVKAATGSVGVWSSADNDPIAEIDAQIEAILTETGQMPNRIALGVGAWKVIKNHAKVLARQPGSVNQGVTMSQFAGMLLNPEIEVRVGVMSRDLSKAGKAANKSNIVGNEVFIFIGSNNPTPYDPSFAKTFKVSSTAVTAVTEYRDDSCHSDVFETQWSEDIQVVSTVCARRITVS
jgi:hypothetical protein